METTLQTPRPPINRQPSVILTSAILAVWATAMPGFAQIPEPSPSPSPTILSSGTFAAPLDLGGNNVYAPTLGSQADGVSFDTNTNLYALNTGYQLFAPADCTSAVGSTHFISVVNANIAVYNLLSGQLETGWPKRIAALAGTAASTNTSTNFFQSLTPGNRVFDPRVIYDASAQRWIVVAIEREVAGSPFSRILIAASATSNPTGVWYTRAVDAAQVLGGANSWVDFPNIAVDGEALYITGNMFAFATGAFTGNRVWIAKKADLYASQASAAITTITSFDPDQGTLGAFSYEAAQVLGGTGVSGGIGTYLVANMPPDGANNEQFKVVRVSNPTGTPVFTSHILNLGNVHDDIGFPGKNAGAPQLVPAGVTARTLETGDRRPTSAVWRNGRLYVCNTVTPNAGDPDAGQATVRWYQFNTTSADALTQEQAGNIGGEDIGAATATSWPAIAVDSSDRVALSLCASNSNINSGIYYTGRTAGDPANTMQVLGTLRAGQGFYYRPGNGRNRWGDYSSISVDPDTQSDFFAFGPYATTPGGLVNAATPTEDGRWATQWGAFTLRQPTFKNDFNNDGYADLVVQNKVSGVLSIYQMNGPAKMRETGTAPTLLATLMQAVGDMNADGKTDFVYKDALANVKTWIMNGTSQAAVAFIYSTTNAKTTFSGPCVATGDFDGDGKTDLVFQNSTTGAVTIWYMGNQPGTVFNTRRMATATLTTQFNNYNQQRVVDAHDYNGDGIPDLVTQNLTTSTTLATRGNVTVYIMAPGSQSSGTISWTSSRGMSPQITTTAIKVVGTDDVDADGLPDLITQQGTALKYYRRTLPTGQTSGTTTTFNYVGPQNFVLSDTGAVMVLPNTNWAVRNGGAL